MTIPDIIAGIEKALEKATPGIWQPCHHLKSPEHDQSCSCGYRGGIWSGDGNHLVVEMGSSPDRDENGSVIGHMMPQADRPTQLADAAYIIATSPGNIRALLTALSEEKARADRAEAERDCAIQAMSGEASARGFAEGKLQASAWPGIIDGWKARAEAAEAAIDAFWEGHRPIGRTKAEHAKQPYVNLTTDSMRALADIAAARFLQSQGGEDANNG